MPTGVYTRTKEHIENLRTALKGKKRSKETRKKLSISHIGNKNPNYGKHASLETRLKRSKAMKGIKFSKEHNQKISKARVGMKFTDEHSENMSKSHIGKPGFWTGKKRPPISEEWRNNLKLCHPKEHFKRIGLIGVQKQQNSKEPTSIEKKVYKELEARHLLFEKQKLINGKFLVDAYISNLNLVIEVDGDYWHSLPRVMKKDKAENAYLTKCGYNLLRLSEKEINDGSFKERMVF